MTSDLTLEGASRAPERRPDARVERGLSLLGGPAAGEGAALIEAAFEDGVAEAAEALATLEAMGAGRPQSWARAFEYLAIAAERGSPRARAQLALLGRSQDWRGVGAQLDIQALLASPARQPVSEQPRIRVFEGFATPEECDWAMSTARDKLRPALVWDPVTGQGQKDPNRSNRALELGLAEMDVVLHLLRARISAASNLPLPVFETAQIMHYRPGEEFRPHYDFLDPTQRGHGPELARFGQRIATFLIYLNDDFEGGETVFPKTGFRYRGRRGDALLFANVDAATRAPDPLTLHAGLPPTRGEKWIFSQWIRDRSPGPAPA